MLRIISRYNVKTIASSSNIGSGKEICAKVSGIFVNRQFAEEHLSRPTESNLRIEDENAEMGN